MSLPHEIYALIATYLPGRDGDLCRRLADHCVIREDRVCEPLDIITLGKVAMFCCDLPEALACTFLNGVLHSFNDQPAIVGRGCAVWLNAGVVHRGGDRPAVQLNGSTMYIMHGVWHRGGDQPAVITKCQTVWYDRGEIHRDFGPAKIFRDNRAGCIIFTHYRRGEIHNSRGPAQIKEHTRFMNNTTVTQYYYNGRRLSHWMWRIARVVCCCRR
jgi:hypothetical protein